MIPDYNISCIIRHRSSYFGYYYQYALYLLMECIKTLKRPFGGLYEKRHYFGSDTPHFINFQ
jgi:hypothetical protein